MTTVNRLLARVEELEKRLANLEKQSTRSEIAGVSQITEAVDSDTYANLPAAGTAGNILLVTDLLDGQLFYDTGSEQRFAGQVYIVDGSLPTNAPNGSLGIRTDEYGFGILNARIGGVWYEIAFSQIAVSTGLINEKIHSDPSVNELAMLGTDTDPAADPGWSTSDTAPMTDPDIYLRFLYNGTAYAVPGWTAI